MCDVWCVIIMRILSVWDWAYGPIFEKAHFLNSSSTAQLRRGPTTYYLSQQTKSTQIIVRIGMMSIYCSLRLFSRFPTIIDGVHQWFWPRVGGYINSCHLEEKGTFYSLFSFFWQYSILILKTFVSRISLIWASEHLQVQNSPPIHRNGEEHHRKPYKVDSNH
jgi:hypothetical protein